MFYIVNTDWNARDDVTTCDLWFDHGMAFAGDYEGNKWKHASLFRRLRTGDILFMYHSKRDKRLHGKNAFIGIGKVRKEWDEKCYKATDRLLYRQELYEYRISVDWFVDWRDSPKDAKEISLFTTPSTWARIDESKYPVQEITRNIVSAKNHTVETAVFTNRGTGGTVPLNVYGRSNTFQLALAEKLAATGLSEAEYVQIAQKFGTAVNRFKAYIRFFQKEGFNIVLEDGRYVQKEKSPNLTGLLALAQMHLNYEKPRREENEKDLSVIVHNGNQIEEDDFKI